MKLLRYLIFLLISILVFKAISSVAPDKTSALFSTQKKSIPKIAQSQLNLFGGFELSLCNILDEDDSELAAGFKIKKQTISSIKKIKSNYQFSFEQKILNKLQSNFLFNLFCSNTNAFIIFLSVLKI